MFLTRGSYRRKIITLGLAVFVALALIATGFASWVLSSNAEKPSEGGVEVGVVEETTIEVTINSITGGVGENNNIFAFEPESDDNSGRVKHSGKTEDYAEALEIKINFTVSNIANVGKIYTNLIIPEGVKKAAEANYITLPAGANADIVIVDTNESKTANKTGTNYTYEYNASTDEATVEYTLKCGWGSVFGGKNPGRYYDEAAQGDVDIEVIKKNLGEMKALMHNTTWDVYKALSLEDQKKPDLGLSASEEDTTYYIGNYKLTIYAEVK